MQHHGTNASRQQCQELMSPTQCSLSTAITLHCSLAAGAAVPSALYSRLESHGVTLCDLVTP